MPNKGGVLVGVCVHTRCIGQTQHPSDHLFPSGLHLSSSVLHHPFSGIYTCEKSMYTHTPAQWYSLEWKTVLNSETGRFSRRYRCWGLLADQCGFQLGTRNYLCESVARMVKEPIDSRRKSYSQKKKSISPTYYQNPQTPVQIYLPTNNSRLQQEKFGYFPP